MEVEIKQAEENLRKILIKDDQGEREWEVKNVNVKGVITLGHIRGRSYNLRLAIPNISNALSVGQQLN